MRGLRRAPPPKVGTWHIGQHLPAMKRYFFDIRDGDKLAIDKEGMVTKGRLPAHIGGMTPRDHWVETLKCSDCGKTGLAEFSQSNGYAFMRGDRRTTADRVPTGFKTVEGIEDVDIFCKKCNISAWVRSSPVRSGLQ
jgi:hypothetical protein